LINIIALSLALNLVQSLGATIVSQRDIKNPPHLPAIIFNFLTHANSFLDKAIWPKKTFCHFS